MIVYTVFDGQLPRRRRVPSAIVRVHLDTSKGAHAQLGGGSSRRRRRYTTDVCVGENDGRRVIELYIDV